MNKPGSSTACCPLCGASLSTGQTVCRCCAPRATADGDVPPALPSEIASGTTQPESPAGELLEAELIAESQPARRSDYQRVINSRTLVLSLLFGLGPFGLPALWHSPRFTVGGKIFWGVVSMLVTTILPAIALYYLVKLMFIPLWVQFTSMF